MPAGMAKVLEMLGSAMDLCDPNGELTVNDTYFEVAKNEQAKLIVSYKTPEGIFNPEDVYIEGATPTIDHISGTATYMLAGSPGGTSYKVASKTSPRSVDITVKTI